MVFIDLNDLLDMANFNPIWYQTRELTIETMNQMVRKDVGGFYQLSLKFGASINKMKRLKPFSFRPQKAFNVRRKTSKQYAMKIINRQKQELMLVIEL